MPRKATVAEYTPHSDPAHSEVIRMVHGRRSENRAMYEAQFLIHDKWTLPKGLKTTNRDEAERHAISEYEKRRAGWQPTSKTHTVEAAAQVVLADLRKVAKRTSVRGKRHTYEAQIRMIKRRIIPDLGKEQVRKVNDADYLEKYRLCLTVTRNGVEVRPSRSTLGNLNAALQRVNAVAVQRGWLSASATAKIKQNKADRGGVRATFAPVEVAKLVEACSPEWIEAGHTELVREQRWMLRAMIAMIACTGIRPGAEIETLTHSQVFLDHQPPDGGQPTILIRMRPNQGKHNKGRDLVLDTEDPCVPYAREFVKAYLDMHLMLVGGDKTATIFCRPSDRKTGIYSVTFREFLSEIGLREDTALGTNRALYSLRHYYATKMCRRGMLQSDLKDRMGTSATMVEKYYYHSTREIEYKPAEPKAVKQIASIRERLRESVPATTADIESFLRDLDPILMKHFADEIVHARAATRAKLQGAKRSEIDVLRALLPAPRQALDVAHDAVSAAVSAVLDQRDEEKEAEILSRIFTEPASGRMATQVS